MINMKALEELRTKEEVLNYFKHLGKNITEEELNALKQNYNKAQEGNSALTLEQLDNVAGGYFIHIYNGIRHYEAKDILIVSDGRGGTMNVPYNYDAKVDAVFANGDCDKGYQLETHSVSGVQFYYIDDKGTISDLKSPWFRSDKKSDLYDYSNRTDVTAIFIAPPDDKNQYEQGNVYFVPNAIMDQIKYLPEYLSTIHDSLSNCYYIDLDAALHFEPVACSPEGNNNDVHMPTPTHSNFARNAAIAAAVIVGCSAVAGIGILGYELYNNKEKEKGKTIK